MSPVELAEDMPSPKRLPAAPSRSRARGLEVVEDLVAVEPLWREFQDEAICSPYQRLDWVRSFADALEAEAGFSTRVLVLRDDADRPLLLLPLALHRRHGMTLAQFVGGKQANFNLPIMAAGASAVLDPAELKHLLVQAGRSLRVDAFVFVNQPLGWREEANPLARFGGRPSANEGFKLTLDGSVDKTMARAFSGETRKTMRKKLRLLSEIGDVRFREARDKGEVEIILNSFFEQKQRRFRAMGVDNPFKGAMCDFLRRATLTGLEGGRPAIELYALSAGERILATFGGTGDRSRLCGMFNSFDSGEDVTRCSPGELLLGHVIGRQCELGRQVFDLGVGEARYKTALCDEVEELIDVLVPVTAQGRLYAMALERFVAAKRFVKHTPWALRAAKALRLVKAAYLA